VSEPWSRPGEPEWIGGRPDRVGVDTVYRYDPAGELVESIDQSRGRTTYSYDRIGQLLSMVPEKARAELFRYDAAGNLFEADVDAAGRVYGKGNRLLRKGDTEYLWDDDGRLAEKRTRSAAGAEEIWKYRWDAAGLLKRVERPDGLVAEFAYDPFARRMSKRVSTPAKGDDAASVVTTKFVWDGDVLVHEIATRAAAAGDPVVEMRTYCFEDGGFAPVAHREAGGWFHYVNDPIGTPERLVGEDGEVACDLQRRTSGGAPTPLNGSATTPICFSGQFDDADVSLRYNRYRYYSSTMGGFVSPDPVRLAGGPNLYRAPRSSLRWADPFGLSVADKLARNMSDDGRPLADGQTAHHIVPREDGGANGDRARAVLDRCGIGINDSVNGARLWGTAQSQVDAPGHPGRGCLGYHGGKVHSDSSYKRVADQLERAEKRGGADAVRAQLSKIGGRMERGKW
jgi:RHS repeat-associated protein